MFIPKEHLDLLLRDPLAAVAPEGWNGCQNCAYYNSLGFSCPAYPDGIPTKILNRQALHLEPLPDQKGLISWQKKDV